MRYQSFDDPRGHFTPEIAHARMAGLRQWMGKARVDAVLVPRADEHQGEYVPACAERLAWLTGFTGSAGLAAVLAERAFLFVDGRYTAQAPTQIATDLFEVVQCPPTDPAAHLTEALGDGTVVGFDPLLHTLAQVERFEAKLKPRGIKLRALPKNPVDRVWGDARPAPPQAPVSIHPQKWAGETAEDKLAALRETLRQNQQDAVLLTLPDSIAWLFNIRGADVAHNPVALAFALVSRRGKAQLFIDSAKLTPEVRAHLKGAVRLRRPDALQTALADLKASGAIVRLDPDTAAYAFWRALGGKAHVARAADPCLLPKARKNDVEIAGMRASHRRDGAVMARFLAWLDGEAPSGTLSEIRVVEKLEALRQDTGQLREISFDTICGAGPHGAVVHYRVSAHTDRRIKAPTLLLIDSGAQYADGTTDITRTVAIGEPTPAQRRMFTLVLKGHIAIATARFPQGTRGVDLDPFARRALWSAGHDFDHGTGHGVGAFLSVHEGPQSISRRGMVPLEAGMIISNEPGYYEEGAYGIRIENLVLVAPLQVPDGGSRAMLSFETLTLAPIDRRLIDGDLLLPEERAWIDAYHARVREALMPDLDAATQRWLRSATAPL
ncbi:MAG: aminopeptidase P family protein [Pseudomonadota bacterium]